MPEQWMSVAEAAAAIRVHPRTVERRIAAGKIESRRNEQGQVQILVDLPDTDETASSSPADPPISTETIQSVREFADRHVDLAAGSAGALVRIAQEQAMRIENQLVLARQDVGRYRRQSQIASGLVAGMLLGTIIAVGWCTHAVTAARGDSRTSQDQIAQAHALARQAVSERDGQRVRLEDAIISQARAEGELAAYKTELASTVQLTTKLPTTRPDSLMSRLARAVDGD